ncbi:ATP/GTP-binding protein [Trueperella pyogenes]|uniref:ATP/GTP-binding protein n=1 Tax=Trueperella pyogenes TaxID=1661 RepID=UPI00345CA70F
MRRRNKYERVVRPLNPERLMNHTHVETADNGMEFKVHKIRAAAKEYLCPGCHGAIRVGEAHVVAWTEDSWFGAQAGQEARRHWHTACWRAKGRHALGTWW